MILSLSIAWSPYTRCQSKGIETKHNLAELDCPYLSNYQNYRAELLDYENPYLILQLEVLSSTYCTKFNVIDRFYRYIIIQGSIWQLILLANIGK